MFCKHLIFGLGMAIIAVLLAPPASAQSCGAPGSNSNVNYTQHQPISQTLTNSCVSPAAIVTLGGEFFFEYHCETKANGDLHEHWTTHYNLTGTDLLTGVKYVGKDSQHSDVKMDPDGFPPQPTADFRTADKFKLIAQGPTPDLTMTQQFHIKVDVNNNPTVEKDGNPVIKCK
jgi:hypothetical protein